MYLYVNNIYETNYILVNRVVPKNGKKTIVDSLLIIFLF